MAAEFKNIIVKKEEGIVTVIINRPEVMNAINEEVIRELTRAVDQVSEDSEARVLILTGAGRAFCAGAQLKGAEKEQALEVEKPEDLRRDVRRVQSLVRKLMDLEIPTIAMVNGPAVGAGWGLANACDMRVASTKAKFAVSFTKVGLIPGSGDTWLLPRLVGVGKAAELIFTGDLIDAQEAERIGAVNKVVPPEELESQTMALARKIAQGPPIALRLDKMLLYKGLNQDRDTALEMIAACAPAAFISEDKKEGIAAFQEKREPCFKGV